MSFDPLKLFLKTGVILAFFRIDGKTTLSTHSLKKSQISEFCFNILTGMSVFWVAFLGSSFLISSATDAFEKLNIEVLFKSFIAIVLGWFVYFNMVLKIGWEILSAKGTAPWKSGIFKPITALEKNLLKI